MNDSVSGKVNAVVASVLGVDENRVLPHARLREELGATDLDVCTLLMALEDELGVELGVASAHELVTVDDLADRCEVARAQSAQ